MVLEIDLTGPKPRLPSKPFANDCLATSEGPLENDVSDTCSGPHPVPPSKPMQFCDADGQTSCSNSEFPGSRECTDARTSCGNSEFPGLRECTDARTSCSNSEFPVLRECIDAHTSYSNSELSGVRECLVWALEQHKLETNQMIKEQLSLLQDMFFESMGLLRADLKLSRKDDRFVSPGSWCDEHPAYSSVQSTDIGKHAAMASRIKTSAGPATSSQHDLMVLKTDEVLPVLPTACRYQKGTQSRSSRTSVVAEMVTRLSTTSKQYPSGHGKASIFILETVPPFIIMLNALTIGMSEDMDSESSVWEVSEVVFVSLFACEFLMKLWVFGRKVYFFGPDRAWNLFDFVCLVVSVADLCVTYLVDVMKLTAGDTFFGLMRMLRLARLARLVRALQFNLFEPLKQMVLGVVAGLQVLLWAVVLFLVCIFLVGVVMRNLVGGKEEGFGSVPAAMLTVFRCFTDGCTAYDGSPLPVRLFRNYGAIFLFGYIMTFMLVSVGVFNLIMAIFIDNVTSRSLKKKLKELGSAQAAVETNVKQTLAKMIHDSRDRQSMNVCHIRSVRASTEYEQAFDDMATENIVVSKDLFREWLQRPDMEAMLENAGVEVAEKAGLFDVLDADMGGTLGLDELITGIMSLRGPITKSDIVAVNLKVRHIEGMLELIYRSTSAIESWTQQRQKRSATQQLLEEFDK